MTSINATVNALTESRRAEAHFSVGGQRHTYPALRQVGRVQTRRQYTFTWDLGASDCVVNIASRQGDVAAAAKSLNVVVALGQTGTDGRSYEELHRDFLAEEMEKTTGEECEGIEEERRQDRVRFRVAAALTESTTANITWTSVGAASHGNVIGGRIAVSEVWIENDPLERVLDWRTGVARVRDDQ